MKRLVILLSAILLFISASYALENMGARPIGMGGAFTGVADDANAVFVNPAGIGYLGKDYFEVSTKILKDKEYTIIGGVKNTAIGRIGIGYVSASYPLGDAVVSAASDQADSPVRALSQSLILSLAREMNEFMVVPEFMGKLSLGANLKFSNNRIKSAQGLSYEDSSTIDMDLAAIFKPNETYALGMNYRNFFEGDYYAEDSGFTLGICGKFLNEALILSVEGDSYGCEWRPVPLLALRAGRDGGYDTAGVGINVMGMGIDYAFRGSESPVHYVAFSIAVDKG